MLRDYQQKAIDDLYDYFRHESGNPCLEMPTGSGKSWVIAGLCKDAMQYGGTRILMLTHVRELIQQNAEKLLQLWPGAPLGIYAASLKRKETHQPITYASVQTLQRNIHATGKPDLIIVDECHRINHKNEGGYRKIIEALNPYRVIGLTASPYRIGHGYITDGEAIFSHIIKPVSIEELVGRGFLAPLSNKNTDHRISTDGVKKRGGEYIESELQAAVNTDHNNVSAVEETIRRAQGRKAWLFFCTGVDHSFAVRDLLRDRGITAETITGKTPTHERDDIIRRYKAGEITALTNANVLTTGFDYPDIDCLVFLRPTMSAALYCQMAGRGMRPKSHIDNCMVLDFAGLVWQHGPVTAITPRKPGKTGLPPIKACENCGEIVPLGTKICPACGTAFESEQPEKSYHLDEKIDIMGQVNKFKVLVDRWRVTVVETKQAQIPSLVIDYFSGFKRTREYLNINHDGYAGRKSMQSLVSICASAGVQLKGLDTTEEIAEALEQGKPPTSIEYVLNGQYENIIKRVWDDDQLQIAG